MPDNSPSGVGGRAQKIRVGAVSYLNTRPLIYGFEKGMMANDIDLLFDYPANIAARLLNKQIDIGLVPVSVIPLLSEKYIISDYCIGSDGEVASVCLFSDVPLAQIETILLDYQSNTSVALLKLLLKEHWNISPVLVAATEDYEKDISGTRAGLVIGDRAFQQRLRSKFIYDLGSAWKEMTGLPFVFAAWVSNIVLPESFKAAFNKANAYGLDNLTEVISTIHSELFDLDDYYRKKVSYTFDAQKEEALQLFLRSVSNSVA